MKLTDLTDNPGARKKFKKLGRGIGSGKGKTCGRGGKGQTARSGVAINGFEGGQMPIFMRLPKRGFNSLNHKVYEVVNTGTIAESITNGKLSSAAVITKELLHEVGLIRSLRNKVKLLSKGDIDVAVKLEVDQCSKAANDKISKVGGSVTLL